MPEHTYRRAVTELNRRGWRTQEPGDDGQAEEPALLRRAVDLMAEQARTVEFLSEQSRISVEMIEAIAPPDERPRLELA
jgi:hypothetical protein